jgi:predicted DNA-binding protein (MmcQ/YjbR family)
LTLAEYDAFCASLANTTHVVQWGDASVWKIGGKVFAIAGWSKGAALAVTFKCSPASFDILRDQRGLRPAPYLASRGLLWIQRTSSDTMSDAALKDYLRQSRLLAAMTLPKKKQAELGVVPLLPRAGEGVGTADG